MRYTVIAEGLSKSFGGQAALDSVDLAIEAGSIFALLGPNGAGKTTIVRILATLVRPDAGRATIAGLDLLTDPVGVRRSISLTGQYAAVDDVLTGQENLEMMARLLRFPRRAARARAGELLTAFGLNDARSRRVRSYSGGMRRRLDLAISMIIRPKLLFLDEPTAGLDPRSREQLWGAVRELADEGVTVLLTTQYLEEADQLADQIALHTRRAEVERRHRGSAAAVRQRRRVRARGSSPGRAARRPAAARDRDRDQRLGGRGAPAARPAGCRRDGRGEGVYPPPEPR
jgi:ABC-2 type transport system ATP-binding protein